MNTKGSIWPYVGFVAIGEVGLLLAAVETRSAGFMIFAIVTILLSIYAAGLAALVRRNQEQNPAQKRKRGGEADMYGLIDRLVNELDEGERAYLRQRLEETDSETTDDDDLTTSLKNLLDSREGRESGVE